MPLVTSPGGSRFVAEWRLPANSGKDFSGVILGLYSITPY